ncbi:hypothetical protein EV702DRAFT_1040609 [Suillus placidus]|uniref:7alpha-cephem-methoxylase P8 chain n=1 Tax=Suillus placidus TaxID=48579 RepID=A0A9P7D9P9_9AGAM|nr:hypothetical protein EV702DRAFT_1040609 [Suillus placidus]
MASNTISTLNYFLSPPNGSPSRPYVDINSGKFVRNWVDDPHDMLDNAGFQYGREATNHTSFLSDAEIEHEYHPECIDIIKRATGATIRRHRPGEDDVSGQPVPMVHVDQTKTSSIARVHQHLPPTEVPSLLRRRFQIINLWRPISHAAVDCPLALCDYRSVDEKIDLVPLAHIYPNREGNSRPRESYALKYNPNHQWKYMRAMTPEEFVLFKCFDSVQDGSVAIFSPHTAFQDLNAEEGMPPRESIEMRFLVFYD